MRGAPIVIVIWTALGTVGMNAQKADTPRFENYPVPEVFAGTPAAPTLSTLEMRRYRTRIRDGVTTGAGLWSGSWKNPVKGIGPNFAGRYFIIRWGCGSDCVMMATVDAMTGSVYEPPLSANGSLNVPFDNPGDKEMDFRLDSRLLVLRSACRDFQNRSSCGNYYFDWKDDRFILVKFVMVNPLKNLAR